jgi:hypothetical protein
LGGHEHSLLHSPGEIKTAWSVVAIDFQGIQRRQSLDRQVVGLREIQPVRGHWLQTMHRSQRSLPDNHVKRQDTERLQYDPVFHRLNLSPLARNRAAKVRQKRFSCNHASGDALNQKQDASILRTTVDED